MAVLSNTGIRAGASGVVAPSDPYTVKRSARFHPAANAHLNWTPPVTGNRRTWTWSGWVKRGTLPGTSANMGLFSQDSNCFFRFSDDNGGDSFRFVETGNDNLVSERLFRDPSAWYHVVVAVDSTISDPAGDPAGSDRVKVYINNERITSWATSDWPGHNHDFDINNGGYAHQIARCQTSAYFDGLMTDIHFIDGQQLAATDFGETDSTTGQWVPKKYTGTYGTNGFHLAMDPANSGTNYSGSGAEAVGGSMQNGGTPYIIDMSPADAQFQYYTNTGGAAQVFNGNVTDTAANMAYLSDLNETTVWTLDLRDEGTITSVKVHGTGGEDYGSTADGDNWVASLLDSSKSAIANTSVTLTSATKTEWTVPVAGTPRYLKFTQTTGSGPLFLLGIEVNGRMLVNHGSIGYDSSGNKNHWHENNLFSNEATVGNDNFKVIKYTGTGSSNAVTGVGFQPDLVWIKNLAQADHSVFDSVRGTDKQLYPSDTGGEYSATGRFTAFGTDGFTVGTTTSLLNEDDANYIAWCWKAGGAASSNSDGSVTSSVSANTTAGFSALTVTAPNSGSSFSFGHGLGKVPAFAIFKDRVAGNNWGIYHKDIATTSDGELLFTTAAAQSYGWFPSAPTSSTMTLSVGGWGTGNSVVGYLWSEIEGHSKFGTYEGSGASQTIDCGFTPAFVMIKRTDTATHWTIYDVRRGDDYWLEANNDNANQTAGTMGLEVRKPNGFLIDGTDNQINSSAGTYIYAAFAGSPGGDLDLLADTPGAPYDNELNGGGNYATLNPLACSEGSPTKNGNLGMAKSTSGHQVVAATMAVSSGKWWWEATIKSLSPDYICFGMWDTSKKLEATLPGYSNTNMWSIQQNTGKVYYNGHYNSTTISSYAAGDDIAIAYDNGSCYVYKNGVVENSGNPVVTGLTGDWAPIFHGVTNSWEWEDINFGQRPFKYTPRTGHKSLNAYNLSDPTITKGNTGFDTKLWTGNDGTTTISGMEFSPDLMWIKNRSNAYHHAVYDTIRGNTAMLSPSENVDEETNYGDVTSQSAGFEIDGNESRVNSNGHTFVGWAWDAGTANVSKSAGDLNSSVYNQSEEWSAGTTSGSAYSGSYTFETTFNGSTTGNGASAATNNGNDYQITLPSGVSIGSGVTVYVAAGQQAANLWLNDREVTMNALITTFTSSDLSGDTTLTKIGVDAGIQVVAVKCDGKLLVDDDVTPTNVPSIASTYRANPNTGFSIVSYTGINGGSFAHGLNAVPDFIAVKRRNTAADWCLWHNGIAITKYLKLNDNSSVQTYNVWGDTLPTSSVISVSGDGYTGNSGDDYIAYCWSEVAGYSKFGTYTGNASTDGTFVWCGFRPAWVMVKRYDAAGSWMILDATRNEYNLANNKLAANEEEEENNNSIVGSGDANSMDLLSNGFKLRATNSETNASSGTFIFAAFAEAPFKYANAR